jgi:hypothetical protein
MFARISKYWSRAFVTAFSIAMLCTMFSGTASAQQGWDKRTRVTFKVPVEIPGLSAQVLPAGTYIFRLMDSQADRHIVQILNTDETHLYANILTIPNYRLRPTDKTVMTFSERKAGEPQAIRAWFYPGDNSGQEFVYPKARAVELAKVTNQPVLFMPTELAPFLIEPVKTATEPPVIALREAPVRAVTPTGQEVALTEVVSPPPVQTASVQQTSGTSQTTGAPQTASLPKTASSLPLLMTMGFFSISLGLSLRTLWRR